MRKEIYDVAILGGGASGLMASCVLDKNLKSILIEKNHHLGKKILSTGSGKCNISNKNISSEYYNLEDKSFLDLIFKTLPPEKVLKFINEELFLFTKTKEEGKIFPYSQKAQSVVYAFENYLKKRNIEIKTLTEIKNIKKEDGIFIIKTENVILEWQNKNTKKEISEIYSKNVILALGSPAYPQIGGSFTGYEIAKSFSHTIKELKPNIVPICTEENLKELKGIRLNVKIKIKEKVFLGELLFTDYGLSGPVILDLSRIVSENKVPIEISVDLLKDYSEDEIYKFIILAKNKDLSFLEFLSSIFDIKLAKYLLLISKIKNDEKISENKIKIIIDKIKRLKFKIIKTKDFSMAVTKIGGVSIKEIKETFESKKVNNLYLTGEILDVDGISGGYNLHFAFTSGYISAKNI